MANSGCNSAGELGASESVIVSDPIGLENSSLTQAAADFGDMDSALGSDSSTTSTSLISSIRNYKYENGRRYHAFREGEYLLPNDEKEQDRMDLHHHVFRLTLGGRLCCTPFASSPHRVLDLGTGTGIWAIEFADEYSSATVIGNDLSPIQPAWIPANCKFIIDDIELDWLFKPDEAFDYIHGRGLGGSIRDWDRLYKQIYDNLTLGGYLEMQEYQAWINSDEDPELMKAPFIAQWQKLVDEASIEFGKRVNIAGNVKQRFFDAGFEDVREEIHKIPIGTWSSDQKMKVLGLYQLEQMCDCVEPFTLALLTRILNWSKLETEILMAKVKGEFRDKENRLYTTFHFVNGRRPLN